MANDLEVSAQGYAPDAYPSHPAMTPREQAAYDAGLRAALDMARVTALTIETAPGPFDLRKRSAVGALYAFAEAAAALAVRQDPDPGLTVMQAIAADPAQLGEIPCPVCSGRFRWLKDSSNGHVHGACEAGCFAVMQ